MSLENETKYEQIEGLNFTINQWNRGCKIMIKKCIQHVMKGNLLLLRDLLEQNL